MFLAARILLADLGVAPLDQQSAAALMPGRSRTISFSSGYRQPLQTDREEKR
jgi:hypothetical protein